MRCETCGYEMQPFETECPRCAQRAAQPCGNCGKPGVVGTCKECGRSICAECAVEHGGVQLCPVCAPADVAAARATEVRDAGSERPLPGPGFVRTANLPGGGGFFDQVRRAWVFMREALTMAFRDKDLLIPPILSVIVSVAFLVAAVLILNALGLWEQLGNEENGSNLTELVIALVTGFIFYAISYFFTDSDVNPNAIDNPKYHTRCL